MKLYLSIAAKTLVGIAISICTLQNEAIAQAKSVYRSEADDLITVRRVAILPVFDNLRGIYSRPVENHLNDYLKNNHHFEIAEATSTGPIMTPEEIEENPKLIAEIAQSLDADAFVASKVIKGPNGLSLRLSLFLTKDKKLLAREDSQGFQRLDVESVKKHAAELMEKVFKKLPYDGVVLSRQGTRVTINLGKKDGILPDQVVSVLQILKLIRHPKFDFLISSEKEIIGKIKLLKVEDTLSFGRIVTEKEPGSIQVNAKIGGLDSVVYSNTDSLSDVKTAEEALLDRPDGKASFGERPQEWLPQKNPTFGSIGARLGVGSFTEKIEKVGGTTLDNSESLYPSIFIDGELWLTPVWSLHAGIRQGIVGSRSIASYEFLTGYNLRLGPGAWAPKIEALGGLMTSRLSSNNSADPADTAKSYSGIKLGVAGSFPLKDESPYAVGAKLFVFMKPKVSEDSGNSGSSKSSIQQFSLFVDKKIKINLKARFTLDFELYESDFSGGIATSSSQKSTNATGGLYYLF